MKYNKAKIMLKEAMASTGYNLTKLASEIQRITGESTSVQNLSNKINRGTIKFSEVELLLNIMGYQLDFVEYMLASVTTVFYPAFIYALTPEETEQIVELLKDNRVPNRLKMELRNRMVHNADTEIRRHSLIFIESALAILNSEKYF